MSYQKLLNQKLYLWRLFKRTGYEVMNITKQNSKI